MQGACGLQASKIGFLVEQMVVKFNIVQTSGYIWLGFQVTLLVRLGHQKPSTMT